MSKENFRFLVKNEDNSYQIKIIPTEDVQSWIRGNPNAIMVRFAVVAKSGAGNLPCDTKEEALQKAKETGGEVRVIKPNEKIFTDLPQEAINLIYQC